MSPTPSTRYPEYIVHYNHIKVLDEIHAVYFGACRHHPFSTMQFSFPTQHTFLRLSDRFISPISFLVGYYRVPDVKVPRTPEPLSYRTAPEPCSKLRYPTVL
jgi:hypothetical protein